MCGQLIGATPAGFPWLAIAGKTLAGWLVIDLDATLITAHCPAGGGSDLEERLSPPPAGGLGGQYARVPGRMLLRPGNAGIEHLRRS